MNWIERHLDCALRWIHTNWQLHDVALKSQTLLLFIRLVRRSIRYPAIHELHYLQKIHTNTRHVLLCLCAWHYIGCNDAKIVHYSMLDARCSVRCIIHQQKCTVCGWSRLLRRYVIENVYVTLKLLGIRWRIRKPFHSGRFSCDSHALVCMVLFYSTSLTLSASQWTDKILCHHITVYVMVLARDPIEWKICRFNSGCISCAQCIAYCGLKSLTEIHLKHLNGVLEMASI